MMGASLSASDISEKQAHNYRNNSYLLFVVDSNIKQERFHSIISILLDIMVTGATKPVIISNILFIVMPLICLMIFTFNTDYKGFILYLLILLKLLTVSHIYICFTVLFKKGYMEELFVYCRICIRN